MKHEKKFVVRAGVFAAGLAAGLAVALMVGAGSASSDPSGEWTASVVEYGDHVVLFHYNTTIFSDLDVTGVVHVPTAAESFLRNQHAELEHKFGPDGERTKEALADYERFMSP